MCPFFVVSVRGSHCFITCSLMNPWAQTWEQDASLCVLIFHLHAHIASFSKQFVDINAKRPHLLFTCFAPLCCFVEFLTITSYTGSEGAQGLRRPLILSFWPPI